MKKNKGVSVLTILLILILIAVVLIIIGYWPFFLDNFNIRKCLRDACEIGNVNLYSEEEKVEDAFFDCIDNTNLHVEVGYEDIEFSQLDGGWSGYLYYYNDSLKIPILNIKLKTIEKEYQEEIYRED